MKQATFQTPGYNVSSLMANHDPKALAETLPRSGPGSPDELPLSAGQAVSIALTLFFKRVTASANGVMVAQIALFSSSTPMVSYTS